MIFEKKKIVSLDIWQNQRAKKNDLLLVQLKKKEMKTKKKVKL